MQPYFLPYLGYFQLMAATDLFVIYDDIQFSKSGWIHRNRMLVNGESQLFTLPLKQDSDHLAIADRQLADTWLGDRNKLLNRVRGAYRSAPHFDETYALFEQILMASTANLHEFLWNSIQCILDHLDCHYRVIRSGELADDPTLTFTDRIFHLCHQVQATEYINPIGGKTLYEQTMFAKQGIRLSFLQMNAVSYSQFNEHFVPGLSILDVLMFNTQGKVRELINKEYQLVEPY